MNIMLPSADTQDYSHDYFEGKRNHVLLVESGVANSILNKYITICIYIYIHISQTSCVMHLCYTHLSANIYSCSIDTEVIQTMHLKTDYLIEKDVHIYLYIFTYYIDRFCAINI